MRPTALLSLSLFQKRTGFFYASHCSSFPARSLWYLQEMLASTSLQIPPLQLNLYCFPSLPVRLSEKRTKWANRECRKAIGTSRFSCQNKLVSTHLQKPDIFTGFVENQVAELPDAFVSVKRLLDPTWLSSMVQSCLNVREVRRVHTTIMKLLGNSVTFVDNNLISAYVKFAKLEDARMVFDGMPDRNVVSWTALLNGYSRTGLEDEFLKLFSEMIENCVQANSLTFVCALNFCSKRLDFELGRQIHASTVKGNLRNLIVDSALVYFYAQCGELDDAFRIFDRMAKWDVVCWTTMITACAQHGYGNKAFWMFSTMQDYGFCPNEFTVSSVLKACGEEKALKFGRQLHGAIVKKVFKDDVVIGSSLVGMYVRCGELLDARAVFDLMPNRNTVTWTTMIAGYAQNGLGEEAIRLFQRMNRRRIFANSSTVVSILSACGSIGSLSLGKEIHGQILKSYIMGNLHIGSTLIWLYCKCGEYAYAAKVLEAMPMRDVISWTAMISGHTGFGHDLEALGFLNKMLWEGVEPNSFTYSSALKACASIQATKRGKLIHASVSKTCNVENVYVGTALISLYMKCGCTTDAFRVFDMMPERNLVSWKAMIVGYAKNGLCGEALMLLYRMQAEGFKVDDYILSTVLGACGDIQWESECNLTSSHVEFFMV